jgi:hypothetical protein
MSDGRRYNPEIYLRASKPFGKTWEKWAAIWCNWLLSVPRANNPSVDDTGKNCGQNQNNPNVWFLGGTFGNTVPVKRICSIPVGKAILFAILEKEDSFAEDLDLKNESELSSRAKNFMDRVTYLQATVDGVKLEDLDKYRVQSEFFDLIFPEHSVYDVKAGVTRAVCDGYWVFLKPLCIGKHEIHFAGEVSLADDVVTEQFKNDSIYMPMWQYIDTNSSFKLDITYELTVD